MSRYGHLLGGLSSIYDLEMVQLLLANGADPNEELTLYSSAKSARTSFSEIGPQYFRTTVWALFLQRLTWEEWASFEPPKRAECQLQVAKLLIENGVATDLRLWRFLPRRRDMDRSRLTSPCLTPSVIFHEYFRPHDAQMLDQLIKKHRSWLTYRIRSVMRRTILLWLYRDIYLSECMVKILYRKVSDPRELIFSIFFHHNAGMILFVEVIGWLLYRLWSEMTELPRLLWAVFGNEFVLLVFKSHLWSLPGMVLVSKSFYCFLRKRESYCIGNGSHDNIRFVSSSNSERLAPNTRGTFRNFPPLPDGQRGI